MPRDVQGVVIEEKALRERLISKGIPRRESWIKDCVRDLLLACSGEGSVLRALNRAVQLEYVSMVFEVCFELYQAGQLPRWAARLALMSAFKAGSEPLLRHFQGHERVTFFFRELSKETIKKPVTVWRGVSLSTPIRGMSWTPKPETACLYAFAGRTKGIDSSWCVVRTVLSPEAVLMPRLDPAWADAELIADPERIGNVYLEDFGLLDSPMLLGSEVPETPRALRLLWERKAVFGSARNKFVIGMIKARFNR